MWDVEGGGGGGRRAGLGYVLILLPPYGLTTEYTKLLFCVEIMSLGPLTMKVYVT